MPPRYVQWTILTLLYVALWKVPLVRKELMIHPQRTDYNIFWEITTCDHSIYTMAHPDFIVCSFMGNSIGLKRVANLWVWDISWQHNLPHYRLPPSLTLVSLLSSFSSSLSTDRLHSSARNNKEYHAWNCDYFLSHQLKRVFWMFKRTVSSRPTPYVLVEKHEN